VTRADVQATIKELILAIKPLEDGFTAIPDDAPLFSNGSGEPSPVNLDSLDVLDLAMSIGDHYNLDSEEFESLVDTESGVEHLRTVNDITDVVLSLLQSSGGTAATPGILHVKEVNR
jgi:acyl carrier protein